MAHKYDPTIFQKQTGAKAQMKVSNLANKTYQQVQDYVDSNVTDLASAKVVMKKMATVLLALLKERDFSS